MHLPDGVCFRIHWATYRAILVFRRSMHSLFLPESRKALHFGVINRALHMWLAAQSVKLSERGNNCATVKGESTQQKSRA